MQRTVRTILVGVMVFLMSFNPAAAWHHWGGGYRGGYCGGGGNYYGYYRSNWSGYSSCGYGGERVVYSSDPYCGGCGGCGSCESCGSGCSSCGGDCGSCGGSSCGGCGSCESGSSCDGCGPGGAVIEFTPHVYQETAPTPPSDMRMHPTQPTPPATVNKPMETTPVPTLPPEPATMPAEESVQPMPAETTETTDPLFGGTPEPTTPAETTPPAEATTPVPSTTPAETPSDDFFGTEPTTPTETPAGTPAEGGATEPSGTDSLFDTPAATGTPESTPETPAEGTTPPAGDPLDMFNSPTETPAEGAAPTEGSTSTDKVKKGRTFLASHTVLREPGGLASSEMRRWVDNTGRYSVNGRLVKFMDGQVRLMKENGRTTTVPLYRLSAADLAFVHRQASAQPKATFAQAGNAGAGEAAAAN